MNLFNPKLTLVPLLCICLCIVSAAFCQNEKKTFGFFYNKASQQLNQDLDSAYMYATSALDLATDNQRWSGYFLLGLVHKKKKEYYRGIFLYKKALSSTNNKTYILYTKNNIANSYLEINKLDKAIAYSRQILKEAPKGYKYLYDALGIIAKCYSKQKKLDSATHYFNKAISFIPKQAYSQEISGFLTAQADMYAENSKVTEALRLYKQSLEHETKPYERAETCLKIGEAHINAQRYQAAQPYIAQAQTTSNQMHIRAKALKLQAAIAYNAKDLPALNVAHQNFKKLLNARGKLKGQDRVMYYNMYEVIYHQNETLKQTNAKKENLVVSIEYWGMWLLALGAVGLACWLMYRNPEFLALVALPGTETLELQPVDTTPKEIKAIDLKYSLNVTHRNRNPHKPPTTGNDGNTVNKLRRSRYRPYKKD